MVNIFLETALVYTRRVKYISKYYILQVVKEDGELYFINRCGILGEEPSISKEKYRTYKRCGRRYQGIKNDLLDSGYSVCHLEDIMYATGRCSIDDFHYFTSITHD